MKAEAGHPDMVMEDFIEDLIGDIEYNMKLVKISDPYFEQLSVEKFALESLLQEIGAQVGIPPTAVAAKFVEKMNSSVGENDKANYTFSISRDAAQSILDGLYFDN